MTDDRSLERAARSWLEEGPTQAPDRAVDAALARIDSTNQERELLPRRIYAMPMSARLAAAAVIVLALAGGAVAALQNLPATGASQSPGATTPADTAPGDTSVPDGVSAFRTARDAACARARAVFTANTDLIGLYDPNVVDARRDQLNARQATIASAVATLADELAAIDAPSELETAHAMDVARQQDLAALFRVQGNLLANGEIGEAASVEQSFEAVQALRTAFEEEHGLQPCP